MEESRREARGKRLNVTRKRAETDSTPEWSQRVLAFPGDGNLRPAGPKKIRAPEPPRGYEVWRL